MRRKILVALLATSALAASAQTASADAPIFDCSYNSVQQDDVTGQNYEGVAWGYVIHAGGGSASIRCYIAVNGSEASSTPTGWGDAVAATAGRVIFAANDTDTVQLCAEVTTSHGSFTVCFGTTHTEIPPSVVSELVADLAGLTQSTMCWLGWTLNPFYPVTQIWIDYDDCDLWVWPARLRLVDYRPIRDGYTGP